MQSVFVNVPDVLVFHMYLRRKVYSLPPIVQFHKINVSDYLAQIRASQPWRLPQCSQLILCHRGSCPGHALEEWCSGISYLYPLDVSSTPPSSDKPAVSLPTESYGFCSSISLQKLRLQSGEPHQLTRGWYETE